VAPTRVTSRSVAGILAESSMALLALAPACLVAGAMGGWLLGRRRVARGGELVPPGDERRFHLLADAAPLGIFELDHRGRVTYASPHWRSMSATPASREGGDDVWAAVHPDDRAAMAGRWAKALREGEPFRARFRVVRDDGSACWVLGQTTPVRHPSGVAAGHVGTVLEVTDLIEARQNMLRFRAVIESTSDYVGLVDGDGNLIYLNQSARQALGVAGDADVGSLDVRSFYTDESWRTVRANALPTVLRGDVWHGELTLVRPDRPEPVPVSNVVLAHHTPDGTLDFFATIARDTSEQKRLEARLQHQASHDQLTGLPNRAPLLAWLADALRNNDPDVGSVAVLFFDIDRFKVVNDSLGHEAGDHLLVAMARRLLSCTRPHDRVARFGGDEFVVVCESVAGQVEAVELANRIRREVGGRFAIGDDEVYATMSIGIALSTSHESAEELLRDADAAMYEAKARGRDRVQLFDIDVRERVVERLDVEQALRNAIGRGELRLHYQPIVDLTTGDIRGVEALVRWEHPERGLLLPGQFLRVAEETGYIIELGRWILTEACELACQLLVRDGHDALPMFVNLSPRQLADAELVPMVRDVINLTGVSPASLHFEITENALMADADTTSSTLLALRELGVRLALDDFGTGHSSLAYLKTFPVEVLKIDRTFIEGLGRDGGDRAITAAIVNVARMLGLATVAEGVESQHQADELNRLGCDHAQGFHFARPMDGVALAALLQRTLTS
jgi:diguanylate cyclase (GGDEF)-like protein/PAS domain S-box-containing protein